MSTVDDVQPEIVLRLLAEAGPQGLTAAQIEYPGHTYMADLLNVLETLHEAGQVRVAGRQPEGARYWALPLPKLPTELTRGGASVAVRLPLEDGMVAHRPASDKRKTPRKAYGQAVYQDVTVPACDTSGKAAVQLSAAWADRHYHAVACTEPACFPAA